MDLQTLDRSLSGAIAACGHDPVAADDLLAKLVASAGLLIAYRTAGDAPLARVLCERAAVGVVRETWAQTGMLANLRGML
ncbi:hypothetical protein ACFZ8E_25025 [Methylobacterium sp. HMF5984]|uniref:hypothetical protein n=1 Tax=Methylobacterium sp. HMF5984 TaxID=3367370 RepID=UPI0038525171